MLSTEEAIIIIIITFIILVLVLLFMIHYSSGGRSSFNRIDKYIKFINEHSKAVLKLKEINKEYIFRSIDLPVYSHDYDNEKFYNEVSCYDYMIYQLQFSSVRTEVMKQINNTDYNKKLYKQYLNEIGNIELGRFDGEIQGLKLEELFKEEREIFNKYKLRPIVYFEIVVNLRCINMGGRFIDGKRYAYNQYDVCHAIDLIKDKNRTFYNNRSIWDSICRVERAKVSNRMRFSIYQRDNYRCKICGRRFETDYLEIDHIYPISKGGKTVYENLQTLCRTCNKNKENKVI